ncbi:MAG: hypothetical protein HYR60_30260 [Acidobacteria bacterium]|nr:hypothetical protein [Acidobacteriota bacterium]MBI3472413.1 hypothetical protein [Candidatus Solibacter usitatus]
MTPQPDYLSVPRRALDVEDYIDILRRHWMWIVGPSFAALVISVAVAFLWPDTFLSYAVMRITPAQVSQSIVPSNFNLQLNERLQTMLQDVTSRSRLIDMIRKFNLYAKERDKKPMEDIVEDMRRKVQILPMEMQGGPQQRAGSAFRIQFAYEDRIAAQKVVNEIVSLFTSQNVQDRRQKSRIATEFLGDEVKGAKDALDKIESELTAFKIRNAGALPDELGANLQTQRSYEVQLQSIQDALHRNQQEKMVLEANIQNYKNQLSALTAVETEAAGSVKNERLVEVERQIFRIESEISAMKERLKADHPDVRAAVAQLETWKTERDRLAQMDEQSKQGASKRRVTNQQVVARQADIEGQIRSLQARVAAINLDMEERVKGESVANESLRKINARIMANPNMQGEYQKLQRDYSLAKANYDDLNSKKNRSEVASRLEDRSAGENLEVLDPATLPQTPTEPKRWMIVCAGVAIGFVVGLFLASMREIKDTTMKGLKDVRAYSNLNVLSSIPLLENALLVRRKRRLAWLAWSSAMIVGVVAMSSSVYYYYWGH